MRVRPIGAGDLGLESRFVCGLSGRTRYLRLMSARGLLPGELERWVHVDPEREIALIAVATIGGVEQQLGVARCVRDAADRGACEVAIVVGDAWQRQGLGEILLRQLMRQAFDAGCAVMNGITLSENHAMLGLARKLGFRARREPGDATVTRIEASTMQ